jgi:predicted nucleic acid-binding protein
VRGAIFVDTSAWYAVADVSDGSHRTAARRLRRVSQRRHLLVTTNHVVGESYTLLLKRLGPRAARDYLRRVRRDPRVRRVFVPEVWEEEAERLLEQYADQPFSYVDATSFMAMRRLGIEKAFAFDRDFLIAGFTLMGDE